MLVSLHAQTAGPFAGSVVDLSGAVVPNAQVSLFLHGGTLAILVAQTTGEGLFCAPQKLASSLTDRLCNLIS
jgi:hypothetical protein